MSTELTAESVFSLAQRVYRETPIGAHPEAQILLTGSELLRLVKLARRDSDPAQAPLGEVVDFRETAFASIPVIAWEVKPELGAKLYAAPVASPAAAQSEHEKMMTDAVIHGAGFMKDGKHEPLDQVMVQPDERAALTDDQRETIREASQCLSYAVTLTQDGYDGETGPASEWDMAAQRLAAELTAILATACVGNDPADCDWPGCGCDEHANKVIGALEESGALKSNPIYQIGANAGGGIAWWDVDKDRYEREKKAGFMKTGIVYREAT